MSESTSTLPQGQDTQQPNPPIPKGEDSAAAAAAAASVASISTAASVDEDVKKRKLENGGFHSSQYFKIRSIVKDLRPFFVEVSQSPNFRESKAAHEIEKRMKTMIELTKQFTASITVHDETHAEEPLSGSFEREQAKELQEVEQAPQPQSSEDIAAIVNSMENVMREQKKDELKELVNLGEEFSGPFLVGGSPIGWNFLAYPGHKPVYYGVSKESALAQRADKYVAP